MATCDRCYVDWYILCLKYEIPAMLESGGGAIVNTASTGGLVGTPGLSPTSQLNTV